MTRLHGTSVLTLLAAAFLFGLPARAGTYYVTVSGLGGEPDYEQRFTAMASELDGLFKGSGGDVHVYTLKSADATREHFIETLQTVARDAKPGDDFVLVLIGHGSFDGVDYKFNLPGPDISGSELAALCDRIASKRQLIVNTTSSSGGSISALQKPGRAIVTATKSGTEKNATVFARYWLEALQDPTADLDKNEAVTALEAFEYADRKTAAFYEAEKRLATEHPSFEDTGKGDAVRATSLEGGEGLLLSSFTLVRLGSNAKVANDPAKRDLLSQKEELEQQIDTLKYEKAALDQDEYTKRLKNYLLQLARVQEELDK